MADELKTSKPLAKLASALEDWDALRDARACMEKAQVDFGHILSQRAIVIELLIQASRELVAADETTPVAPQRVTVGKEPAK